jgi:nicotinamidase-related amidase
MSEMEASLDPARTAVLVVDVQPFFADQDLQPPVGEVLPRLRRFLDAAREAGILRVFIRAEFPPERWTSVWEEQYGEELGSLLVPGSSEVEFQPGFEPEPGDPVVVKDCYSSFLRTGLEQLLQSRGIDTVVVTGLTTDVCVSSTARDAFQLDFRTITLSDCCAEGTLVRHESGLETLASNFGRVCTSAELMAAWTAAAV